MNKLIVALSVLSVASAAPQYLLGAGYAGIGLAPYAGIGYAVPQLAVPVIKPDADKAVNEAGQTMVTYHASGAVVPEEPHANQVAKAAHLSVKTGLPHEIFKREAEAKPEAEADPLTVYANGAVVPNLTPSVAAATASHLSTKAAEYAAKGYLYAPYALGYGYGHHMVGKRSAEADPWTVYANGAVVPSLTPSVAAATASHLAAKGYAYAPYALGYGYGVRHLGKREAEAEADPLTIYANGAVVPNLTPSVAAATVSHLTTKAEEYAAKGLVYAPYAPYNLGYAYLG